jgi:hypothetical protein
LFENQLPQLLVELAVQRAGRLRLDLEGVHWRLPWTLQSGTPGCKSGSLLTSIPGRTMTRLDQASQ